MTKLLNQSSEITFQTVDGRARGISARVYVAGHPTEEWNLTFRSSLCTDGVDGDGIGPCLSDKRKVAGGHVLRAVFWDGRQDIRRVVWL